jgi:hypothetical protein
MFCSVVVLNYFAAEVHFSCGIKEKRSAFDRFSKTESRERRLTPAALSAAVATSIATVTATAATAWWARLARTRFVHGQGTAFECRAIDFRNCLLRICVGGHGDESEATGFAGEFVLHQHDFLNWARFGKKLLKFIFGGVKWEISHV